MQNSVLLDFDILTDKLATAEATISANDQLIKLEQDPLALSWASYHVWQRSNGSHRWADLADLTAGEHDIEMANVCRKYYCDRLLIDTLKGGTLSTYRRTLYALLTRQKALSQGDLGIIYRLPYFYVEDTHRDTLQTMFANRHVDFIQPPVEQVRKISALTEILKSRRAVETHEFWFKDEEHNVPVCWSVINSNPLKSLLNSIYNSSFEKPIAIRGKWLPKLLRGFEYYQVGAGELV
jgi:hypothetical protein